MGNKQSVEVLGAIRSLDIGTVSIGSDQFKNARELIGTWISPVNDNPNTASYHRDSEVGKVLEPLIELAKTSLDKIPFFSNDTIPLRIYIPSLRGLRRLDDSHRDYYAETTKTSYFNDLPTSEAGKDQGKVEYLDIYTGLSFFDRIRSLRLGNLADRQRLDQYEKFLTETFFGGKPVELIPSERINLVTIKIGKEIERPIHELGDGIQSAIILSFLPFIYKDLSAFFFIEEPEMFMHPGLQRKVLQFYADQPLHRYFLTTHSNHLLDLTTDIESVSVFTFQKQLNLDIEGDELPPAFYVNAVNSGNRSSLELLGVRNSSVFLVNSTIWVEGITDRLYLRKMLQEYMAQEGRIVYEEDVHYAFVEYGGSNIIHWSFLDSNRDQIEVARLCSKAMVIVDDDGGTKMDRKEAIREKLGDDRFIVLPGREIENMLPYDVIRDVVLDYEKNNELNIKIYSHEKYLKKPIGTFIEETMLAGNPSRKGGYKEKSGTVKDKLGFSDRAIPMIRISNIPPETLSVIEKIYKFIEAENSL